MMTAFVIITFSVGCERLVYTYFFHVMSSGNLPDHDVRIDWWHLITLSANISMSKHP